MSSPPLHLGPNFSDTIEINLCPHSIMNEPGEPLSMENPSVSERISKHVIIAFSHSTCHMSGAVGRMK